MCVMVQSSLSYGQTRTVSGTVSEDNGDPIIGATVQIKGTTIGTVTDIDGRYTLSIESSNPVLVFRSVGFKNQEVALGNQSVVNVTLDRDVSSLNEVVVVGYGTQRRSDLTGSVSSVKSEELTAFPAINVAQALQGRAAGVNIQANNGAPGSSFKIRIRGGTSINASSDPIFVVDGFIGGALPPPEDIESIEVLKDASATAIYGSRGANGVILVTTRRGKKGAPRIEFNTAFSSQEEIARLDLLNASEFMDYIQEIRPQFNSLGADTNWQDEIFRPGFIQNHQFSISGASDNVDYYVSSAFFDQKGVIIGSGFNRFSVTSNVNIKASERLKIGMNMFVQRSAQEGTRTQENSGGSNNTGVVAGAFKFEPDQPVFDENGRYTIARMNDPHDNPVAVAREFQNETETDRIQVNFLADYQLTDNLTFRTTLGGTTSSAREGTYLPTLLNAGRNVGGQGSITGRRSTLLLNENYLTYTKSFNNVHNLTVMGGYSYQSQVNENWSATGQNFVTDAFEFWNLGAASVWQRPTSSLSDWVLSSFYARLNYGYDDRYLVQFNARYDGSSTFSANNKWAFFPSTALAWNVSNEDFLKDNETVSMFKIRGSYGLTGNQAISPFQTLARFSDIFTVVDGRPTNAIRPTTVANDNLTWETTAQLNIGTDLSFFSDRFYATFEYYRMVTRDLLFQVPLPQYSGFTSQLQNAGRVENKGIEITVGGRIIDRGFQWNTDFNLSTNRNQVLSLPNGNDILYGAFPGHMVGLGQTHILREGFPVGSFFGWIYDGVYQVGDTFIPGGGFEQAPGGERFRDLNGDGILNANDRDIIGNPHPNFIFGWNNDFTWKNFDLNIFFQGTQGNDILSYTLMELDLLSGINNATRMALNRWTPENTDTDVPRAALGRARRVSTRFIYDGSYIRLRNLALGYNLPYDVARRVGVQRARIFVSAQNILTFTNYRGYDPEVNWNSGGAANGNLNLGIDYGSYPNVKSYTLGLNIAF
ncbi:SusC/RagA family TonB-linked outer membrane protein [Mongoliitalea lutea]|uniref:SusC/RagA family TonB-linked outer membrane protein n=2 Tax=Mongoliitalea lutea TaxID=849756 RepID=A0A8J3G5N6_9BACT|nr:SusC/RagA family TonB-linked outer membrane protein [Mongoliitalea lutea]